MPVDQPSLSNTFDSQFLDETYTQSDSSEFIRILRGRGSPLSSHLKLEEKIRGSVERARERRTKTQDRESLRQSWLRELEGAATATEGLRKGLEEAKNMVTKSQELREREKEDLQNYVTSIEEKHQELVSELEKKDQVREVLLAELRHQHKNSEQVWREHQDQMDREIERLQLAAESEKVKLGQDLLDDFEREQRRIQEETEKHRNAEKEVMDATLEEERRGARQQLERAESEHLKREEELEGQLEQARGIAVAAEADLREQQREEQELLNQLEQARKEAKETETRMQQQLRKEQKDREEEKERFRAAIEEEKARVRQEFYSGFFGDLLKEKALLMEWVRKDIHDMREDIKKELKMKTEEKREEDILILNEVRLEGEETPVVGEEWDSDVARD